jgi:hypothetical protein
MLRFFCSLFKQSVNISDYTASESWTISEEEEEEEEEEESEKAQPQTLHLTRWTKKITTNFSHSYGFPVRALNL